MLRRRFIPFAGLAVAAASVTAAPPTPVEAPYPAASGAVPVADVDADREREQVRAEFIEARETFAKLLTSALSSEELADRAGHLGVRIQLRRAEERLHEVETRLSEVEAEGRADSDEARRLRDRAAAARKEVDRLSSPDAVPAAENTAGMATKALAARFQASMADETAYLADVLDNDELRERTRRTRRLIAVSQFADGLRALRQERDRDVRPAAAPRDDARNVVPAGGTVPADEPGNDSLGGASNTPPE